MDVNLPGLVWSMEGRPCSMRVLAGAGVCGTGRVVTHTGLGWMGGLVLRMVLAFNVAELGRTAGWEKQTHTSEIFYLRWHESELAAKLAGQTQSFVTQINVHTRVLSGFFFTESFACTDTLTHVLFGGAAVQSCAACTEVCSETLSTLNQRFLDGFDLTITQCRLLAPRRVSQFFQKVSLAPNFTKSKDKNTNLCSRTLFLLLFSGWKAAGRRCSNTASVIKCYLCLWHWQRIFIRLYFNMSQIVVFVLWVLLQNRHPLHRLIYTDHTCVAGKSRVFPSGCHALL